MTTIKIKIEKYYHEVKSEIHFEFWNKTNGIARIIKSDNKIIADIRPLRNEKFEYETMEDAVRFIKHEIDVYFERVGIDTKYTGVKL